MHPCIICKFKKKKEKKERNEAVSRLLVRLEGPSPIPSLSKWVRGSPATLAGRSALGHPASPILFAAFPISRSGLDTQLSWPPERPQFIASGLLAAVNTCATPMSPCRSCVAGCLTP